jgi:hypothetical protein
LTITLPLLLVTTSALLGAPKPLSPGSNASYGAALVKKGCAADEAEGPAEAYTGATAVPPAALAAGWKRDSGGTPRGLLGIAGRAEKPNPGGPGLASWLRALAAAAAAAAAALAARCGGRPPAADTGLAGLLPAFAGALLLLLLLLLPGAGGGLPALLGGAEGLLLLWLFFGGC